MNPQVYDTLILSDVHLGADMSRAREALRVLQESQCGLYRSVGKKAHQD